MSNLYRLIALIAFLTGLALMSGVAVADTINSQPSIQGYEGAHSQSAAAPSMSCTMSLSARGLGPRDLSAASSAVGECHGLADQCGMMSDSQPLGPRDLSATASGRVARMPEAACGG